jgi:AhpC/TSA family
VPGRPPAHDDTTDTTSSARRAGRPAGSKPGRWPSGWSGWLVVATTLAAVAAGLLAARGLLVGPRQAAEQRATPAASPTTPPTVAAARLGVTPGRRAPDFAIPTASGGRFHLAAQHGHAVVLTFLAPGCSDCTQELAALNRAWQDYKDRGVAVLVVDLGGGPLDQAVAYYPSVGGGAYLYGTDPAFRLAKQYQMVALGTTVIVDPTGHRRLPGRGHHPTRRAGGRAPKGPGLSVRGPQ